MTNLNLSKLDRYLEGSDSNDVGVIFWCGCEHKICKI